MMKLLGLNRPLPLVDSSTLLLILAASFLFSVEGIFDLRLKQYVAAPLAIIIYIAVGFAAIWQTLRQKS